jgi:pimeloyl-ACP methyl ester carboxylesterase
MSAFPWRPGETGVLEIGGARLEAACHGPRPDEAPTIALLHEGLGCVALWRDFPQRLAQATGFGVFVYSRLGYGRSAPVALPRPLDYMTREATATLPLVLDAAAVERAVLLGHSDGASIAAIYAGAFDDPRLRGLALIAPHFFAEPEGLQAIRAAEQAFAEGDLRDRLAKYHDDVGGAFYGWSRAWLDPGFARWNIADAIDGWRIPAFVVQGDQDPYGTAAQVDEISARARAPVEILMLPGCGHAPQFERAQETLAALAGFCLRVARR